MSTRASTGTKPKQISQEDTTELRMRLAAVQVARNQYLLVEEAYQGFVQRLAKTYKFKGQFNVDANGFLVPIARGVEDAGSDDEEKAGG